MCCWTSAMNVKRNLTTDHCNSLYIIREQKVEKSFDNNTSINRFVVSEANWNVCSSLIVAMARTACCMVTIPMVFISWKVRRDLRIRCPLNLAQSRLAMLMRPISSRHTFEMHYRENMYFDDYEVRLRKGYIYIYIYIMIMQTMKRHKSSVKWSKNQMIV